MMANGANPWNFLKNATRKHGVFASSGHLMCLPMSGEVWRVRFVPESTICAMTLIAAEYYVKLETINNPPTGIPLYWAVCLVLLLAKSTYFADSILIFAYLTRCGV